jgi:signal transduction histidine kinase/ligand-binding sensor domain-containing protein/DNA-binding response OmpR family regulator
MNRVAFIIFSVFALLISLPDKAAKMEQPFHFRHFTSADGLASNSVASVCPDKSGTIWAATSDGIFRYCGDRFELIDPPADDDFTISDINFMIIDNTNNLWIAANSGVYQYNIENDKYVRIILKDERGTQFNSNVNTLAEDKDGNIWFSTYGDGILRYDRQTALTKKYDFPGTINFSDKVFIDSDNIVWAAFRNRGKPLIRLNKNTDKFEFVNLHYDNPANSDDILTIFEDSKKNLWLGTWVKGVQKFDKYSGTVTTYPEQPLIPWMHIHSISEYQPDRLLVGSDDGLLLFDTDTKNYKLFTPDNSNPSSISDKFVYPITKDNEGGIWIGTYYGGINYVSPYNDLFYVNSCSQFTGSNSGSIVSRICEGNNGDIWLGTDDKGLIRFNPFDGSYHHFMPEPGRNSISYYNVHGLCFDGDNLWIGTYAGGLNIYDTKRNQFRTYNANSYGGLDNLSFFSIFKDREGNMWIGTMAGIDFYDRNNDSFHTVKPTGGTVIDIKQDMDGKMWFATFTSGVHSYNPYTGEWKEYLPNRAGTTQLEKSFNTLFVDEENAIWAGTSNGLYRYNPLKDCFDPVLIRPQKDNICCILGDNHILWISTTSGLIRFEPKSGNYIGYSTADGLQSDHFIAASGIKSKDGVIYFGSVNGFISFRPYEVRTNTIVPKVVLTGLEINNTPVKVGKDTPLKKAIDYLDRIDLKHSQNKIIIHYSALSFSTPEKIKYAYRLSGSDVDWNYVSNLRSATYTNIPPGTYEFQVKSSTANGVWDNNYKSIQLVVHPPLWFSPFALVIYTIIAILLIIRMVKFFVRRAEKKHHQKTELLNQKREKEIYDEKIRFFTSIAHEIRTPLSLIIGPIERILSKDGHHKENVNDELNTINSNSHRLLSLVNQLLDFRKTEQETGIRLYFVKRNIPALINSVIETYIPYMKQYGVEFNVAQIDNFEAEVDPEAITKILSNLLTNAAKYGRGKAELKCIVNQQEQSFSIIVSDNGNGVPQEEIENIFKPFYRISKDNNGTGIGLSIVNSIVNAHNGKISVNSTPKNGSSFIITLPLQQYKEDSGTDHETVPDDILEGINSQVDSDNKTSLLIVEDNKEMMVFLYDILSDDYNVLTSKDGADALEILKTHNISIIVCDWMMPVMDGIELCKAIRKNIYTSHIPFIMLTAKTDINSRIESMEAGVDIFIEKPFSVNYLNACIKNLLDTRRAMMEKFSKTPLVPLSGIATNSLNEQFLSQVSNIIEENISNIDLSVDFIVRQMHISRSGFFAKIKTQVDVTPNDLIQIIRLKKAASLMLQNRYLVSEICYMVGFKNPSYFSKCFHKQFGVTPVDFIKNNCKPQ